MHVVCVIKHWAFKYLTAHDFSLAGHFLFWCAKCKRWIIWESFQHNPCHQKPPVVAVDMDKWQSPLVIFKVYLFQTLSVAHWLLTEENYTCCVVMYYIHILLLQLIHSQMKKAFYDLRLWQVRSFLVEKQNKMSVYSLFRLNVLVSRELTHTVPCRLEHHQQCKTMKENPKNL